MYWERIGGCPNNDVARRLANSTNPLIIGAWSVIGSKVVCLDRSKLDVGGKDVDMEAVSQMFSTDPIAETLIKRIIGFTTDKTDMIIVAQEDTIFQSAEDDIAKKLASCKDAKLVLRSGSEFAALLTRDIPIDKDKFSFYVPSEPEAIIVWFWQL